MSEEPDTKRIKAAEGNEESTETMRTCKHFVARKKRYCRITVAKDEDFCGEHLPVSETTDDLEISDKKLNHIRIPCPLDPKHTVYAKNLQKHLKICNAIVKDRPEYIVPGLNAGLADSEQSSENVDFKLADVDAKTIDEIIEKINKIFDENKIDDKIEELFVSHSLLEPEIGKEEYGAETLKHLVQTSAILGYLDHYQLFDDHISYVEYGAGKGQVSYWLAQAITDYPNSNVLLIDRASLRHKKDNKLEDKRAVQRIRADIADFDIGKYDLIQKSKKIVGVGKHLCGAATDFAIRCTLHGNTSVNRGNSTKNNPKTVAFVIALCCHHRCDWKPFVGKEFFIRNQISMKEFTIITKMVGWAICGTGMSRERRKKLEEQKNAAENGNADEVNVDDTSIVNGVNYELRAERKEIGRRCKRLIDFARICFLHENGYECFLKKYVSSDVTLENVCLVALLQNDQNSTQSKQN